MADFRVYAIIRKPVEEVFNYAVNLENAPKFMPFVKKTVKSTNEPIQKGSKFIETRMIRGKETKAELELTEFNPNHSYTVVNAANGLVTTYHYIFEEIEEGTQAEMQVTVNPKGLFSFLTKKALVNIIKKEDGHQLGYLKDVLEEE